MLFFCELDHAAGWTKQIHLGVIRNVNRRAMKELGPDTGFDTITDTNQGAGLAAFLGEAAGRGHLPQTILFNLNPNHNHLFATMCGNFQGLGAGPGHVQWGTAWWYNDQRDGMADQIDILSQVGLLSHFVGMLTDSRSLLSYPRHEVFRRVLCAAVGRDADAGELSGGANWPPKVAWGGMYFSKAHERERHHAESNRVPGLCNLPSD